MNDLVPARPAPNARIWRLLRQVQAAIWEQQRRRDWYDGRDGAPDDLGARAYQGVARAARRVTDELSVALHEALDAIEENKFELAESVLEEALKC